MAVPRRTQPFFERITVTGSSRTWISAGATGATASISVRRPSPYCLASSLDLLEEELGHLLALGEQFLQGAAFLLQLGQLLLDLDAFEARQLAQADLEDVLGLGLGEAEARDQVGLGSSDSRMTLITLSMFRKAIMRPSRMWMRRSTWPGGGAVRRSTVTKRKSIHS
jgi:hypothetical protein